MPKHKILLCVDNSAESDHAIAQTAVIGRAFDSEVVAAHVYAARLHDRRFTDLEPNLPQQYQTPQKMESSRRTHAGLIGHGLKMISDSYLKVAQRRLEGLPVRCMSIEGTHYVELTRESALAYDLMIIGARGLGLASLKNETPNAMLGGVSERVLRRTRTDILIVKDDRPPEGTILVAIDGSPDSYSALRKAINLAKAVGAAIECVTCFDPDYHPVAFKAIAGVLSEKHSKMFKFQEQENLHNEIIDHGLENLYQRYLENAKFVAEGKAFALTTRLLMGRPACQVSRRAKETDAALLVVGRFGRHQTEDLDIGNTAETIVRLAPCNVLVINEQPDEEPLSWTEEAQNRVNKVPEFMRPMVRKVIESHARAHGLHEVDAETVSAAKTSHGVPLPGHGVEGAVEG